MRFLVESMLFKTVVFPNILTDFPEEPSTLIFTNRIQLLKDLLENCLILVDDQKEIEQLIVQAIERWPIKFRMPAQKLLRAIQDKNRLVFAEKTIQKSENCTLEQCQICIGLSLAQNSYATFVTHDCFKCINEAKLNINPVYIDEYPISSFHDNRKDKTTIARLNEM